jgi:hypothetical protein
VKRSDVPVDAVLRAIRDYPAGTHIPRLFPQFPQKLTEKRLEQLCDQGLIDFGVVITRPWLTSAGKERIGASP